MNYRKIWEEANGPIPIDEAGRSFEIHHIDGDRNNNTLINLQCVSIIDHLIIHTKQGDWGAVTAILMRMDCTPDQTHKTHYMSEGSLHQTKGIDQFAYHV